MKHINDIKSEQEDAHEQIRAITLARYGEHIDYLNKQYDF